MNNVIGTCSECGGPVTMPTMSVRPVATCERCGAVQANAHGPVIKMTPIDKGVSRRPIDEMPSPYDLSDPRHPARQRRRRW